MITINDLRSFIIEVKDAIPDINYTQLLMNDQEFAEVVTQRTEDDHTMLYAVVPSYSINGKEDSVVTINRMMFLFLNKVIDRDKEADNYYLMMHQIQDIARQFLQLLLDEKSNQNTFCGVFSELIEDSTESYPIFNKNQCHGWALEFDLKTNFV
jgi:hypothetical protein